LCAAGFHYREALPGYHYQFPRDHFDHPDFRTEWWYYTGNLTGSKGERFGFELVFFRQAKSRDESANASVWRVDDLYLAHAAVTDVDGRTFRYAERLNRAGPGIAGISFEKRKVWNGNWRAQWDGEKQTLTAIADEFRFTLQAAPVKPLVIHGIGGVSQKAEGAGRASHYVSFPRMTVSGTLLVGDQSHQVSGLAWMDHEWFTEQLDPAQRGWDWFSVQLEDRTELMLFDLRRTDGSIDPHSSGTFVDAAGRSRHLTSEEFNLRPLEYWKKYPVKWKIEVPSLGLSLDCSAAVREQELVAEQSKTSYWEGAVTYSGSKKGVGYLEMTGYEKPVSF
jgi:predicted secreted hydrolase